ncbi:MAG: hypothetical protein MN733_13895 [Nitrososphaera sp.]|nr:hypothetical protein [Nitrososphaera sp.]
MELNIGSNIFRNTNGVLALQGKEQIVLEMNPDQTQLLLTMDLYDTEGSHIAHLRRNSWAFNDKTRFQLSTSPVAASLFTDPVWLKLTNKETGDVVLELIAVDKERVHVLRGKFHTHKGKLVEITSHYCRMIGGITKFGDVADVRGGAAVIG